MAWKKIIVSGSQAELNQITVDNTVTANAFSGGGASITGVVHNAGEIASEISGSLGANATLIRSLTASGISGSFDALSGSIATRFDGLTSDYTELTNIPGGIISSSAQVVSSLDNQEVDLGTAAITASFFKGDGSQLTNIDIASVSTVVDSFTNATTRTITHNFGTKNVLATVYNSDDEQIIPSNVITTDANTLTVSFDTATSGRVIVGKGGHVVSGSIPFDNLLNTPTLISSSAQVDYESIQNTPDLSGIISGSSIASSAQGQVALTSNGVAATAVDLGLQTNDSPTFASLTLTGDLTVQGTTTSVQAANLLVEDKFILLSSGSTSTSEGGIIVDGGDDNGKGYGYDSGQSRWGFESGLSDGATGIAPTAFAAAVVDIDAGNSDISEHQKNGNIKVDSGTIYIYA